MRSYPRTEHVKHQFLSIIIVHRLLYSLFPTLFPLPLSMSTSTMLRRVITTAPRASRALSTSIRPAITSQARIAAPASQISRRCYHEKDKFPIHQDIYYCPRSAIPSQHKSRSNPTAKIPPNPQLTSPLLLDHYSSPRNVGSMDKSSPSVGTGLVGAPACGDVMKLQIQVDPATNTISDVKFKTFGCGSAIASSSYLTELVRGMTLEDAGKVRNTEIARGERIIFCGILDGCG